VDSIARIDFELTNTRDILKNLPEGTESDDRVYAENFLQYFEKFMRTADGKLEDLRAMISKIERNATDAVKYYACPDNWTAENFLEAVATLIEMVNATIVGIEKEVEAEHNRAMREAKGKGKKRTLVGGSGAMAGVRNLRKTANGKIRSLAGEKIIFVNGRATFASLIRKNPRRTNYTNAGSNPNGNIPEVDQAMALGKKFYCANLT
jgi:hypothetical protein